MDNTTTSNEIKETGHIQIGKGVMQMSSKTLTKASQISFTPSPQKSGIDLASPMPAIRLNSDTLLDSQIKTLRLSNPVSRKRTDTTERTDFSRSTTLSSKMSNFLNNYDELINLCKSQSNDKTDTTDIEVSTFDESDSVGLSFQAKAVDTKSIFFNFKFS